MTEIITKTFQVATFKALYCCMTGLILSKNIYLGGTMVFIIVLYLLTIN